MLIFIHCCNRQRLWIVKSDEGKFNAVTWLAEVQFKMCVDRNFVKEISAKCTCDSLRYCSYFSRQTSPVREFEMARIYRKIQLHPTTSGTISIEWKVVLRCAVSPIQRHVRLFCHCFFGHLTQRISAHLYRYCSQYCTAFAIRFYLIYFTIFSWI